MAAADQAQMLALQALGWLVAQPDHIGGFLAASGLSPDDLRARAGEPEFLASVLDFLLQDEPLLLAFCADTGQAPQKPMQARALLPGGEQPHWT